MHKVYATRKQTHAVVPSGESLTGDTPLLLLLVLNRKVLQEKTVNCQRNRNFMMKWHASGIYLAVVNLFWD